MRIGNTDDLADSGKSDELIALLRPENQKPLTGVQK